MDRTQKAETVKSLNGLFADAGAVVVAHYSGMTVAQMGELRSRLSEFVAAKRKQRAPSRASVIRLRLIDAIAPVMPAERFVDDSGNIVRRLSAPAVCRQTSGMPLPS